MPAQEVEIVPLSPQEWRDAILSTVEDDADDRGDGIVGSSPRRPASDP